MCQGVVISLVKFNAKGKNKSVILSGIGSHSDLIKDNKSRLERLGWTENSTNQNVYSIESDFSGWNKFTIESDQPHEKDLQRLKIAYKKCAGNAKALISHVKKCGKIDDALIRLLSQLAWAEYKKVTQPARAEYEKVRQLALAEYKKVEQQEWAEYQKVRQQAWAEYEKIEQQARAEYEKVTQLAWAEYHKIKQQAWIKLFSKKLNRVTRLQ